MAELIVTATPFSLASTWRSTYLPSGAIYRTEPTGGSVTKKFNLSTIPYGSTIKSALLKTVYSVGYSGGSLRINGKAAAEEMDVTDLIRPNSVGNFTEIGISYTYNANGGIGQPAPSVSTALHYSYCNIASIEIQIEYEPGQGVAVDAAAFREAALSIAREIAPRAVITYPSGAQQPIPADQIISFSINEGIKSGILLGAVASSVLELRLSNESGQWNPGGAMRGTRTPLGAKITMAVGLKVDGEWMYQPAGVFTVEKFLGKATEPAVTFHGFDEMSTAMEREFTDGLTYPQTLSAILAHISERAGIPFTGALAANGDISIPSKPEWGEECTLRQALSWVCQAGASYGMINRDGVLGIYPTWRQDQMLEIGPEHYMAYTRDERKFTFNHLHITPIDDGDTIKAVADSTIGATTANTLTIEKNPLFKANQTASQQMADGICAALTGAQWRAADFRWRGDPAVMIGCRTYATEMSGEIAESTIANQSMKWDMGFSMTGKCDIDIGRAFADLGFDESAIGGLPYGTKIRITESNGAVWYTIVDTDYSGMVLLLRDTVYGYSRYMYSTPSNVAILRYNNSYLDNQGKTFYEGLPDGTKALIGLATIPVSEYSGGPAITLQRNVFSVSAAELGLSSNEKEGEPIEYLGTLAADQAYWTREASGGTAEYAYAITTGGVRSTVNVTNNLYFRPAFCLPKNIGVKAIDGGFEPIILEEVSEE